MTVLKIEQIYMVYTSFQNYRSYQHQHTYGSVHTAPNKVVDRPQRESKMMSEKWTELNFLDQGAQTDSPIQPLLCIY